MESRPKIYRNLLLVIFSLFFILALSIFIVLSSEGLTRYAINTFVSNYIPVEKIGLEIKEVKGCLLDGITVEEIKIKHLKPNFDLTIRDFKLETQLSQIFYKGVVGLSGSIGSIDGTGTLKLPSSVASVPAFIGPECFAGVPSNIRINNFTINNINYLPCNNESLRFSTNSITLSQSNETNKLDVETNINIQWKEKAFAKIAFAGKYDQKKNKVSGNTHINVAKQLIVSDISLANGKHGLEVNGYIASDSYLDLQPLSQWLGYMWQTEYPYAICGKILLQGSWLYNPELGFMGNLIGKYEKIDVSIMGLFFSLIELNGDWKLFDNSLNIKDSGSKLLGLPAALNGKVDNLLSDNRKYNVNFNCNSIRLDELTSNLPWMLKYTNGIPDLNGIATVSVKLEGKRPTVKAEIKCHELSRINSKSGLESSVNGFAALLLPETGDVAVKADFIAKTNTGFPLFLNKYYRDLANKATQNKDKLIYKYNISGKLNDKIILNGILRSDDIDLLVTEGELVDDKFYIKPKSENRVYNLFAVDPIDLFLDK